MKLLSFGEILFDVFPDKSHIGGAPLNFAAHAAKQGADVWMVSAVGEDALGKNAIQQLKVWNINSDFVKTLPDKPTGKCLVTLDNNSIPLYNLLSDVAYDYIPVPKVNEKFDILYFGTLALRNDNNINTVKSLLDMKICKEVFVDMNIRPPYYSLETMLFALSNATVLKISDEELPIIMNTVFDLCDDDTDKAVARITEKFNNLKLIILTRGADGSTAYDVNTGEIFNCAAEKTNVISTVGAGDSFSATFITNFFDGKTITECLKQASVISAYVVSKVEAVPEY